MIAGPAAPGTVVITGASSGLGAQLAALYAGPGVRLALVGRDEARLAAVAERCRGAGAEVETAALDVGAPEPLGAWLLALDARSPVDVLIANAGASSGVQPGRASEGLESAAGQVRTNLLGCLHTVEPLAPRMAARGQGRIAVVASVAGLRALPYSPAYGASKAGVRAYGEAMRGLLRGHGVAVTVVCPGFFRSPMTDRFAGPTPWAWSAERTARLVKRGIDRRRARVSFPWPLVAGVTLANIGPARLTDAIVRRFRFHIEPPERL